jgi:hypothetical protein
MMKVFNLSEQEEDPRDWSQDCGLEAIAIIQHKIGAQAGCAIAGWFRLRRSIVSIYSQFCIQ